MSNFIAVGMRFRGNYRFSADDVITVQVDNDNPHDANAVKILVADGETDSLNHVAYVSRQDCQKVRRAISEGRDTARLLEHYGRSASLALID